MTRLKELYATGMCGIDDNGIGNNNLEKLDASYNQKITNVNHMTKLKKLEAYGDCGIDDDGIKNLNLEILCANYNVRITRKI